MNPPALFSRRDFLAATAAAAAATATRARGAAAAAPAAGLVDTHVYLGRWPFRRAPLDEPAALVAKLRAHGVTAAWAASLDALLHKDIAGLNARLAEECARHGAGLLVPVAALNPSLLGWERELRRCASEHRMRAVRLHPNYHRYTLADPLAARVLGLAAELGLLVQIPLLMEDERTIHPLVNVPPVNAAPLADLLKKIPALRVQLLNAHRTLRGAPLLSLAAQGVHFDLSNLEGVEGVTHLLSQLPVQRLCFGSYAPVFYFEAAMLKLKESVLDDATLAAVRSANAHRLLARA
ncbi:MAG: amidohydrolase family protein [Opitutaceae bacterium]|nr:amidohydrolase family protein [Opitutaceae bacterium]